TEEIVQEVFIKLWKKRAELEEVKNFESYLFTMATNKTYDFLRKMATEKEMKKQVWQSMQTFTNNTLETLDLKQSEISKRSY
ncbi:MAG: RNA polymerase sigma-70 factor, partial [Chitinophagaceae bacterium]|nr:RNA polymerase sigma-70 factor [Chitinophagaceae bacterium]